VPEHTTGKAARTKRAILHLLIVFPDTDIALIAA
jgi:hypothetical protein